MTDLESYRVALPAVEVCARAGVSLNGSRMALCIAHAEKTPSMRVYEHHAHCFSCGAHMDGIALAHWARTGKVDPAPRGPEFWEDVRWIARESGLPEPHRDPEAEARYETARSIEETYAALWQEALKDPEPALAYLESRGISRQTSEGRVGYLPKSYKPKDEEAAQRAGLFSQKGNFLFADRAIVPVTYHGRIVNLYGRVLRPDGIPKHIYCCGDTDPPMPAALWNLDECRRGKEVFITESIIDAMTLIDRGIPSVVAAFGTQGLNDARVQLLKRSRVEKVSLVFDNEASGSGEKGALAAGERLFRAGLDVSIITLPRGEGETKVDPNTYFHDHTADDFRALPAKNYFTSRLESIPTDGSPREKHRALEPLLKLVAEQPDLTWKEYGKAIAQRFPALDERKISKAIGEKREGATEAHTKRDRFLPLEYVDKIRSEAPVITFDGRAYRYSAGVYAPWYLEEIDQRIIELYGPETEPKHLHAIREMLFSVSFVRPETVNPPGLLNLKNGLLRLESDEFIPHTPEILSTVQAETRFDPTAECPLWIQTVAEILPDPTSQALLAQIFGACLVPSNSHQKGFIFWGDGANGKSVVTDVLEAVIGRENTAALHLTDFQERFRLAELQNKLINFSTEVEAKGLVSDARIKSIVSGDPLTAERKNQQPFVFRPFCKLVISCNNLPQTTDRSYGYFRRWLLIPFTQTFSGTKQDRNRGRTIIETELSGVLNWAIGGYKALRESRQFIDSKATAEALHEYKRQTDPVIDFTEERIRVSGGDSGTPLTEVYKAYNKWSLEFGYQPLGRNNFYRAIQRAVDRVPKRDRENGAVIPGVFLL